MYNEFSISITLISHVQKILDFFPAIRYSDLFLLFGGEEGKKE